MIDESDTAGLLPGVRGRLGKDVEMSNHGGIGNMKQGFRYVVTKESDDGTFGVGDHIWMCVNGDVASREEQGWIDKADVEEATLGMEVEVDVEWAERRRKKLLQDLAELSPHHKTPGVELT